jgi:hypothetical protein
MPLLLLLLLVFFHSIMHEHKGTQHTNMQKLIESIDHYHTINKEMYPQCNHDLESIRQKSRWESPYLDTLELE